MRGSPVPDRSAAVTVIISIHASTWETATIQIQILKEHVLFQFTPLHERQPTAQLMSLKSSSNFNSRLYMRGSSIRALLVNPEYSFQFTPLHERQLREFVDDSDFYDFNSRLYMRGSQGIRTRKRVHFKFQFTPLHERQQKVSVYCKQVDDISIHASTWEAAASNIAVVVSMSYFNSRLYMRGSHLTENCAEDREAISIHASTWEAAYFSCFFSL